MLILTLKARQFINRAVNQFGSDFQKEIWRGWSRAHPDVRKGPADPFDDGTGPMPREVIEAVRSALNQLFNAIAAQAQAAPEDDAADLCNDLSFIRSVIKSLGMHAPETLVS